MVSTSEIRRVTLRELNQAARAAFVAVLGDTVENAPWVAEALERRRPFRSVDAVWCTIMDILMTAPRDARLALFRGHPELAGIEAAEHRMSAHSTREQDRLGLTAMPPRDMRRLHEMNRRYRERFGYPCIVALRRQPDLPALLDAIAARLDNDPATEHDLALGEIGEIVRGRLDMRIAEAAACDG
ncbi:2-oxo-4-hydroxy-4-carboxy-5-ureidoimidazoline decarboxylase [Sphingomonas sp. CL5.1]|uniref:2-oxo-4-hydroxy-4-carboxy-5-ureidoimidazoline decarboxylase n=1 Tax=Sphingomonas sp. CL5.1 TaxID=2653203 RepID=UPI001583CC86|nr:2-oxo-4-hydroxy-4-carboxy-5-ureidoimidazoline decarboxylase [Sphingomonas sp. CL5.1]QKS00441.1 2-oxo-4-hydroxy-4-carboxy-5-ureidoimidazoline decarboxylase [Sphingomonas sp. CL5.1]